MVRIYFTILWFCSNFICISQNNLEVNNHPLIKASELKNLELKEGNYDLAFTLTNEEKWNLKISIPKIELTEKVPLIIALHWAGDKKTYKEFNDCLVYPALKSINAIIISPSSDNKHWLNSAIETRVINLIKQVKKLWPVNAKKIIITGYSNGAIGSWEYSKKHPNLFSASIPIAGYYSISKIKTPTYIIHGEKDELFNVNKVKKAIKKSIKKGSNIKYEVIPSFSHFMGCAYINALKHNAELVKKEHWNTK